MIFIETCKKITRYGKVSLGWVINKISKVIRNDHLYMHCTYRLQYYIYFDINAHAVYQKTTTKVVEHIYETINLVNYTVSLKIRENRKNELKSL